MIPDKRFEIDKFLESFHDLTQGAMTNDHICCDPKDGQLNTDGETSNWILNTSQILKASPSLPEPDSDFRPIKIMLAICLWYPRSLLDGD